MEVYTVLYLFSQNEAVRQKLLHFSSTYIYQTFYSYLYSKGVCSYNSHLIYITFYSFKTVKKNLSTKWNRNLVLSNVLCCCLHLVSCHQISQWPSVLWWSSCCFGLSRQMYCYNLFSSPQYGWASLGVLIHSCHCQLLLIVYHVKKYHDGVQSYLPSHQLVQMSVWCFPIGKNITTAIFKIFPKPLKCLLSKSS